LALKISSFLVMDFYMSIPLYHTFFCPSIRGWGTFDKKDLNKELIKLYVDNGIPIIMNFAAHSRVVVGYDYRNGKDEIIFDDPSGSKADFEVDRESILGLLQNTKIRVSGILFERVR
ncbi:MAG: hypothetical protein HFE51_11020, partial [Clostridia bacterium]|nr:hypothetical protein [Clostridia bacterium]